MQPSLN
ncbi:putative flagellar hook-associated protein, partial [Vibrio parahaemolyticus V-223/04]